MTSEPYKPVSFPHFGSEVIDVKTNAAQLWLMEFPFQLKGKCASDVVSFSLDTNEPSSAIVFHENPYKRDLCRPPTNVSKKDTWKKTIVQRVQFPSNCALADISGNGFHDVIIADEYGESLNAMDPYGGRVSWLENFGTDDGDWIRRDIGRFPGVNCLKVGHFTTTFSLQILAVVQTLNPKISAPLIIFTRPSDVYKARSWLATTALENIFSTICGCLVVKATDNSLDKVVISSREGLIVVWYSDKTWHRRSISCNFPNGLYSPGRLAAGVVKNDSTPFIISAEATKGSALEVYVRLRTTPVDAPFESMSWMCTVLEDFDPIDGLDSSSIRDVVCADLDGDGTDEILVAVSSLGSRAGIYYYDLVDGHFIKYKVSDEPAEKVIVGHFANRERMDFAAISCATPRTITIHFNSFLNSEVRASIKGSELFFRISRAPTCISEVDIIDIAGRVHSLVSIPPNTSFSLPTDGTNAVKVLHGCLGWIDIQSVLIERNRVAAPPGCVTSMLVDCPEGYVRSGNDGAVFVRMRPSCRTNVTNLRGINVLPPYFCCETRDLEFLWQQACRQSWFPAEDGEGKELYHLPGYHICFDDPSESSATSALASALVYVHLWAAAPGVSSGFHKYNLSPLSPPSPHPGYRHPQQPCSIRVCLSNPAGDGGLHFVDGVTHPNLAHSNRVQKMILPVMHEHGPFWRPLLFDDRMGIEYDSQAVDYPWHAWVAGGQPNTRERMKWDVWMAFDFAPFDIHTSGSKLGEPSCVIT